MDERIKYLMYGLAFGRKLPVREKEPPVFNFEEFGLTKQYDQNIVIRGGAYITAAYEPKNARETDWNIQLDKTLGELQSPFEVVNTGVPNVKLLKLNPTSGMYNIYASQVEDGEYTQWIETKTIDSKFSLRDSLIGRGIVSGGNSSLLSYTRLWRVLYGATPRSESASKLLVDVQIGCVFYLGIGNNMLIDEFNMEIEGSSITTNGLEITAVSVGNTDVTIKCGDVFIAKYEVRVRKSGNRVSGVSLRGACGKHIYNGVAKYGENIYTLQLEIPGSGIAYALKDYYFDPEDYIVSGDIGVVELLDSKNIKISGQGNAILKCTVIRESVDGDITSYSNIPVYGAPKITGSIKGESPYGYSTITITTDGNTGGFTGNIINVIDTPGVSVLGRYHDGSGVVFAYIKTDESGHDLTFNINNIPGSEVSITV